MSEENALTGSEQPATATVEKPAEANTEAQIDTNAGQQAGEGGSEPEKKTDTSEDAKRKSRAQERVEQATRETKRLRRENARLYREIGKLKAEAPPPEGDTIAAMKYAAREAALESQLAGVNSELEGQTSKRQEAWGEVVAEARQSMPDFDAVFDASVPVSEAMADLIMEADHPAQLAYYLGKNRSEAYRISQLPPIEAARALGRLEARLAPAEVKRISSAPKPVSTVSGKGSAPPARDLHELAKSEDASAFIEEARRRAKAKGA